MAKQSKPQDRGAPANPLAVLGNLTDEQIALIKATVAKDTTDDELALFLYTAKSTGLDPLRKQIHAIKRLDRKTDKRVMTIQTGIDGYRVLAERTGCYVPGREPTFEVSPKDPSHPLSATAYIKKLVANAWHEVAATARWDEYVQTYFDKGTNRWEPTPFWKRMPFGQLAKCAEALALRRAFPDALGGLYTHEEMAQADREEPPRDILTELPWNQKPKSSPAPGAAATLKIERINEETGEVTEEPAGDPTASVTSDPPAVPAPARAPAAQPARSAARAKPRPAGSF
jgi:phage recombination protein Bet